MRALMQLAGITKVYGVEFIVSGETARQAARYLYRELDRVQVKGKAKPVTILEPIGLESELSVERKAAVKAFHDFLKRYRGRRWDEAEAAGRIEYLEKGATRVSAPILANFVDFI